ncbi:hypothetical protein [Nocardioides acrostichi]|uniref:Uncharacterized protein n=1 Tax=Nocardioides acrostichi TaxID=2784339 RepID=A0A930UZB1_9ACTN|nr:hypothetical protein [Nocardioides acrostichi]MBF4163668.1 hypothetical protein [Nocardioides acrostichi]
MTTADDDLVTQHSRRRLPVLALVLLAALVNLPLVTTVREDRRLDDDATSVSAPARIVGEPAARHVVVSLPDAVDGPGPEQAVTLTADAARAVQRTGEVRVSYLADDPSVYRVEGTSSPLLVIGLVGDGVLVLLVALFWVAVRRRRPVDA